MALRGTPQGTRLGKEQETLPTQVGGQWSAESPQAPAGHRGKEAHSHHRPYLAACSVPSPAQRSIREEPWTQSQEVRAAAPALWPQGPAGQAGKGGWSEPPNGTPAHPPAWHFCQESFFSPAAAAPTPLNLSLETGSFSLGGEGCQVIGPV